VEEFMSENIFSSVEKSPDQKPIFKKTKGTDYNLTIQRVQREPEERYKSEFNQLTTFDIATPTQIASDI
jgi:hypothetical protein